MIVNLILNMLVDEYRNCCQISIGKKSIILVLIILLFLKNLIQILNLLILKRVKESRLLSIRIFLTKSTLKMFIINFCD